MKQKRTNLLLAIISLTGMTIASNASPADTKVGMNLGSLCDWGTAFPLVDLFKSSRAWISQTEGKSWGQGPTLELDKNGWIKSLQTGSFAEVPFFPESAGTIPQGEYVILYEGKGTLKVRGVTTTSQKPGRITFNTSPTTKTSWITITKTDPSDYIRNIRILLPGSENTYKSSPWNLQFLARWKGVACLRFMEWMNTNHSEVETWEQRPHLDNMSYTGAFAGVPLELMIDLCNQLKTDAWFCMPHRADDNYIQKFATMVHQRLNPDLKVYVEFSNEVWNSQFKQTKENTAKAISSNIGNPESPWEGNALLYTDRTVSIGKIWHDIFDDDSRVIRVLAWQCAAYWFQNILLPHNDAYQHIDAVAIAPYINLAVLPKGSQTTPPANELAQWSEEKLMDHVEKVCLPVAIKHIRDIKKVVASKKLPLIVYEGGQHMVGVSGGENNKGVTALLTKANKNPRMKPLYQKYFKAWEKEGGGLFCYFTSTSRWSKWGSWGVLDRYDADPTTSPKYTTLIEWAQHLGQKMKIQTVPKGM